MANITYLQLHQDQLRDVGDGIFLDTRTGLIVYQTNNGSFVGEGISYLTPVKKEWVIGVARVKIPLVGYVRLLPNYIADQIRRLIG
jgi:signal peptidase